MGNKNKIRNIVNALIGPCGFRIERIAQGCHDESGLRSIHNHDFLEDPAFIAAYERGVAAAGDLNWRWRVHIGLWVAHSASKLDGDFVECGVNRGFLSSAIMQYLDWDSLSKTFYLLDTFQGLDEKHVSEAEAKSGALSVSKQWLDNGKYVADVESVRANFSEWQNVRIIQGAVPGTLSSVNTKSVAYLHIDMNCSPPEVASFEFFWDKLVPGAFVLLDDYAYHGHLLQKGPMDEAAEAKGVKVVSLPTGQGLLVKPAV